ncbi:MAG: 3-oxoacid CoA-transferase subunit B [Chloroflexota bacterium]|nr:3-oxoacid CoA-transferase subunit B [Chloroflexota bacterium]
MSAVRGWSDQQIAHRVIADLWEGAYVNLGVGLPILVLEELPAGLHVLLHSENGTLGMGPPPPEDQRDPDLMNAGGTFLSVAPGGVVFDSSESFAMLRGGHVDVALLGAYQVSEHGDIANWKRPGQKIAGIGGAADIAVGAKQLWVMMNHVTKDGQARILRQCTFPLTAGGVVKRIYTDMAVIDVKPDGLHLLEVAPGLTAEEVATATDAPLKLPA